MLFRYVEKERKHLSPLHVIPTATGQVGTACVCVCVCSHDSRRIRPQGLQPVSVRVPLLRARRAEQLHWAPGSLR